MLRALKTDGIIIACIAMLVAASVARAAVIHVPSEQPTIQAGVDASVDGDTIQLAGYGFDGPGNVDVVLNNRNVSIIGEGPDETFIIGQYASQGFLAYMTDAKPILLQDMRILQCRTDGDGGGVCIINGSPTLRNIVFENCRAGNDGGAFFGKWCTSLAVENVTILDCSAGRYGGGLALDDMVAPALDTVRFEECRASDIGGALYCESVVNGAVSDLSVIECNGYGWGIVTMESDIVFDHGMVRGSGHSGGGILVGLDCDVELTGFSIVNNGSRGLHCEGEVDTRLILSKCVIAFNRGQIYGLPSADIRISDCNIYGSGQNDIGGGMVDPIGQNGTISADPRFCDLADGELTVSNYSPCLPENNASGVLMGYVGQGCVEPRNTLHVPAQYYNIQYAVDMCAHGDTIVIAPGVYTGWGNRDILCEHKEVHIIGSGGSENTLIDCEGEAWGIRAWGGPGLTQFTLRGVTIVNGVDDDYEGVLGLHNLRGEVDDVRIFDGTGIISGVCLTYCLDSRFSNVWIERCEGAFVSAFYIEGAGIVDLSEVLIRDNTASANYGVIATSNSTLHGSGLTLIENSTPVIFAQNQSQLSLGLNIIAHNYGEAPALKIEPNDYIYDLSTVILACNDFFDNSGGDVCDLLADPIGVNGNIAEDPLFCGPAMENFHLAADSPCLPDNNSCGVLMGMFGQGCGPTAVATPGAPATDYLAANHPNPFNPTTKIAFGLKEPAEVTLRIYDAGGRLVRTLLNGETRDAGRHEATWTGRDDAGIRLSSGVYFYRLKAGAFTDTRKMTLLK